MRKQKLALAIAALVTLPLSVGCAVKFEARLLDPFNRTASTSGEAALVGRARHLLAGGLTPVEVVANLVATGQTEDEARRIVALATPGK